MKRPSGNRSSESLTEEDRRATFDHQHKVMMMFSDNAKTYIQLSGAALALTVTFAHQILHIPEGRNVVDPWMVIMWVCFLIAIIAGAYQYLAAKFMEASIDWESYDAWNWLQPGSIYGSMLGAFYEAPLSSRFTRS
jgi:hypothetical protein